jgi:chromosomal replication initiation ATPase DnaA
MDAMVYAGLASARKFKTIEEIEKVVCKIYEIDITLFKSKTRIREVVDARKAFYYMVRRLKPKTSLSSIGRYLNQHHATVLHGVNMCNMLIEHDAAFRIKINECLNYISALEKGEFNEDIHRTKSFNTIGYYYNKTDEQKKDLSELFL